ncbi:hypothetical protein H6P81_010891 [Aristolochia fimbriata]|uniref:Cyclin-dependent kinase inhibitor domain-containing protein n=1 Tax=Aristolochia fimbriata TaxID=158543 RepID=A0AAV7ESU1_ARIFI|nr:hypothetical protein H6P81_010891 [Aristolochia fimbriata]
MVRVHSNWAPPPPSPPPPGFGGVLAESPNQPPAHELVVIRKGEKGFLGAEVDEALVLLRWKTHPPRVPSHYALDSEDPIPGNDRVGASINHLWGPPRGAHASWEHTPPTPLACCHARNPPPLPLLIPFPILAYPRQFSINLVRPMPPCFFVLTLSPSAGTSRVRKGRSTARKKERNREVSSESSERRERERTRTEGGRKGRLMGKYMRKCKGMGEIAVMEVGPLTRARTLALAAASGKRRKVAAAAAAAVELPLRGRRVAAADKPASCRKSPGSARVTADRCPSADRIVASRCSSNGSCDRRMERLRSADLEAAGGEGFEVSLDLDSAERRETTPSSNLRADYDDLDSTTAPSSDSNSGRKPTAPPKMPSEAEIEDFFSSAESHERKRFVEKYNFDVKKEAPLDGRYEWSLWEASSVCTIYGKASFSANP